MYIQIQLDYKMSCFLTRSPIRPIFQSSWLLVKGLTVLSFYFSMLWNKEPVTAKRLHLEPRDGGHVDLLISELSYMS